ncbi:MAG: acyl-protein synthetase [Zetaproteobacteria bacterium CG06_land_8_20_14_3_00_59_53]|nr:MAG: hypothetical protein AUK36_06925 [Zetaproteobacteria bacterium CG2_30_59_37]PIO90313.1 MAG: acyl-protein synthetase [Zetaproteobacteria bacterium CG23_combo_of_CG06-09_8_20_14_all_59_86]PIQ65888.1 MAG: acyl-protein synthetase [Zetaproteobacteria bacterium CG11_big_fil_rev_8_21_14_0_20_59_439]PIU70526.1 MAG: acyl-protein synthetase [Zetaproteobacteria bacterium CG06_land_8_20_14_3_00_59_53]PIU97609.1 MAG: acyl-protein synthetase [Zetaproteobacteria bacterium CG03_land_8_20_14_0_80_59_51]
MQISLPLDEMTTQEKISAMEALWHDLSKDSETYASPLWHKEVLECREAEGGEFVDWDEAKQQIRKDLCK